MVQDSCLEWNLVQWKIAADHRSLEEFTLPWPCFGSFQLQLVTFSFPGTVSEALTWLQVAARSYQARSRSHRRHHAEQNHLGCAQSVSTFRNCGPCLYNLRYPKNSFMAQYYWGLYYKTLRITEKEKIYGKGENLRINFLRNHLSVN